MNFFKIFELFLQTHGRNKASDTQENNIITRTRETSIDQCNSQVNDNNSNKPDTECNVEDDTTTTNTSVDKFDVTEILHNLENVAPIKINPKDTTYKELKENEISFNDEVGSEDDIILINATKTTSVGNVIEDEPDINQSNNDLTQALVTQKAVGPNDVTYNSETATVNSANDETIETLKKFEEALNNIDTTDFGTELINLDDFIEIFDELDAVNEDLVSTNGSVTNNENATYCKENKITNRNKNETNSDINENIDIISINSSNEDEKSQKEEINDTISIHAVSDEPDSDDGYKSSDFEFISETEANMAGFVINYGLDEYQNPSQASSEPLLCFSGQCLDDEGEKEASDPGEGPSRQNRPRNEFEDRSYRNDHHIPIGDDYLGLFQGIYNPQLSMSEIYFLENKSVRTSAMNSQYDGIGFDKQLALRRHQPDSSEDEFEDEAKESAKKILRMYPGENRKRRRRHL